MGKKKLCHSEEGGNRGGASTAGRGARGSHPTIGICMFGIILNIMLPMVPRKSDEHALPNSFTCFCSDHAVASDLLPVSRCYHRAGIHLPPFIESRPDSCVGASFPFLFLFLSPPVFPVPCPSCVHFPEHWHQQLPSPGA